MEIPPVSASQFHSGSSSDPVVDQLHELWDAWYNDPTQKTGQALLDFLKKNQDHLSKVADANPNPPEPPPHGSPPFDESYKSAENTLQNWLDHGCDPTGTPAPSEFIEDVASWVDYAR